MNKFAGLWRGAFAVLRRVARPYRPVWRRQQAELAAQYDEFFRGRGPELKAELAAMPGTRTAVLVGYDSVKLAVFQVPVLCALRMSGYRVIVLLSSDGGATSTFYRTVGAEEVVSIEELDIDTDAEILATLVEGCQSQKTMLGLRYKGIGIGRFVVSTLMRSLRMGSIDPRRAEVVARIELAISASMRAVDVGKEIVARYRPELVCFYDRGYTPDGELFDVALASGAQAMTLNAGHRSGVVLAKLYNLTNHQQHFAAPSEKLWNELKTMPWDSVDRSKLIGEIERCYRNGSWYDEVGTQFRKKIVERDEVLTLLDLDLKKKVAVIFPHLFWDATFFWGDDLFDDYKDWFCRVLEVAAKNEQLNWIIKVHPAGLVKDVRDGYDGESSEMIAVRETLGTLPNHIKLIPPDSSLSTFSLFGVMDYCLTVRGTVGIEAAVFGAAVITAGTGRYDGYGFTIDPKSRQEYLGLLSRLEAVPPPTGAQIELASRYAYGLFLVRPLQWDSIKFLYLQDESASLQVELGLPEGASLESCADLKSLASWLAARDDEDLIGDRPWGPAKAKSAML